MSYEFRIGDVFDRLAEIPDNSIDLLVTSPPFLGLRSYLPSDHAHKHREIGAEQTPADFLDTLLALTIEFDRLLAPHGSICVELGDTYSGSGGAGGDYNPGGMREGQERFKQAPKHAVPDAKYGKGRDWGSERTRRAGKRDKPYPGWPLAKSQTGIPTLYTWSLAYGRNLLREPFTAVELLDWIDGLRAAGLSADAALATAGGWVAEHGEPQRFDPWRIRNVIVWARPNPPVGALGDKFRPATSYITVACKSGKRWFDLDAVRTQLIAPHDAPSENGERIRSNPAGPPPLDWQDDMPDEDGDWLWKLATQPYKGSHYATFPMALPKRLIEAMCPRRVCTTCGKPSERIPDPLTLDSYRESERPQTIKAVALADEHGLTDEHIAAIRAFGTSDAGKATLLNDGFGKNTDEVKRLAEEAKAVLGGYFREFVMNTNATRQSEWSDCGHDAWRTGVVLDPFIGSGTTLDAALAVGRHAIGIDIDPRNADLARDRIGMFLTIVN